MSLPKTLVICISAHHGNTMKVADKITKTLEADAVSPLELAPENIANYDLVGFGSGIYNHKHHQALFNLLEKLPVVENKKAFVFSTNTFGLKMLHEEFIKKLKEKGFIVVDEFSCPGFMDYSFTKYFFGGINKKRPNEKDLSLATKFALQMKDI